MADLSGRVPVINQLDRLIACSSVLRTVCKLSFRSSNCIAFSASGTERESRLCGCTFNGDDGEKTLLLGDNYANKTGVIFWGNRNDML